MGFLWADFELQMDTKSIRYVNDLVWYYYSVIGFFPLVFITIYKVTYLILNKSAFNKPCKFEAARRCQINEKKMG